MDRRTTAWRPARPAQARRPFLGRAPRSAIAVSLFAVISLVGPVAAAQPYITRNIVDGPHIDVIDCGTFTATLERNFTGTDTFFVDRQDQPVREQFVANIVGTLTSDTGTVVNLRGHILFVIDFVNGTYAFDGQVFMAHRPGIGVVIQDTGKYLTDSSDNILLEAGPHDVTDYGGAVFCAALR